MAHAFARTRRLATDSVEAARIVIVASCALALIAAGQILPL